MEERGLMFLLRNFTTDSREGRGTRPGLWASPQVFAFIQSHSPSFFNHFCPYLTN